MKYHVSKFLKSLAWVYISFPVSYILLVAVFFNVPFGKCILLLLDPFFYFVAILAMLAGFGFREMRRWSWYIFVTANVLITYHSARLVITSGETNYKALAFSFLLALILAVTYKVSNEIRVPYFFPKIRWWESNPRYQLAVPSSLERKDPNQTDPNAKHLEGEILDLSVGGVFIKLRQELKAEEAITVRFSALGFPLALDGTVVWKTQSTVTHPKGVGIKFLAVGKKERRILHLVMRQLRKVASLYRRSRYLISQEEFLKRVAEIEAQTTHQARQIRSGSWSHK
ncbi:PilZ domain-containing protein [Bdellovibrionota bacterium FG-2]